MYIPNGVGYCGASSVIFHSGKRNNPSGKIAASSMMMFDFFIVKAFSDFFSVLKRKARAKRLLSPLLGK